MVHIGLLEITDSNVSNKNDHKTLALRTIRSVFQETILRRAFVFSELYLSLLSDQLAFIVDSISKLNDVLAIRQQLFNGRIPLYE